MLKLYFIKILWAILFIVWAFLIAIISVLPDSGGIIEQSVSEFRWDYLEHFLGYFILGILYILWRSNRDFKINIIELTLFLVIGSLFGWIAEYIQIFIPGRTFNIIDLLYNLVGIITGTLLGYFLVVRLLIRRNFSGSQEIKGLTE